MLALEDREAQQQKDMLLEAYLPACRYLEAFTMVLVYVLLKLYQLECWSPQIQEAKVSFR